MEENEQLEATEAIRGTLYVDVACDWGDEIDLLHAGELAPSAEQKLERRARTPNSITYRPAPALFMLDSITVELDVGRRYQAAVQATAFDFGGVNIRVDIPLELTRREWHRMATNLSLLSEIVRSARAAAEPLFRRISPAITAPDWQEFYEEYLVFHFDPATLRVRDEITGETAAWLGGLLRQESGPLSMQETAEALRLQLRYSPTDLVVIDWAAAAVVDTDCEETLRTIEFANLQLLEFRHLDQRLDRSLEAVYRLIHSTSGKALMRRHSPAQSLRMLGDLRIETELIFERAGNALQLVGDQYLARLYRLLVTRFHLDQWSQSVRQSLAVAEGVYQVLAEQVSARRIEVMEFIVIVLIATEILLGLYSDMH